MAATNRKNRTTAMTRRKADRLAMH
jgi:hypothetical protein